MSLYLSTAALDAAEDHRAGEDFRLLIDVAGVALPEDRHPMVISGQHEEGVTSETWQRALEQTQFSDVYT